MGWKLSGSDCLRQMCDGLGIRKKLCTCSSLRCHYQFTPLSDYVITLGIMVKAGMFCSFVVLTSGCSGSIFRTSLHEK